MRAAIAAGSAALIVFARAALPGRAKTRLIPRLGAWRAARLHAALTACALRTARDAGFETVELHVTPRRSRALFSPYENAFQAKIRYQKGADLGARMLHAFEMALRRNRAAILIGTDCPALGAADLRRAARLLASGCDAVLAPAEDGGYALIALRKVSPRIFEGIAWGGNNVFLKTAERLSRLGLRWRALRTVWDLDRPGDLERLRGLRPGRVRSLRFSSGPPPRARRSGGSRARWGGSGRT